MVTKLKEPTVKLTKHSNLKASNNEVGDINIIRNFLTETGIEFTSPVPGHFDLLEGKVQLRYVYSPKHKMDFSKRFGIEGIPHNYFSSLSKKNRENGIRTIWIKDWELNDPRKWNVLQSYIKTACGKIENRFYGRDCEIRVIDAKELRPFLETNCFYGFRGSSLSLGLYAKKKRGNIEKDTLLMVYTFGHPFFGKKLYDVEVIRVATLLNCQVIGGASKLLKYFTDNYPSLTIGDKEVEVNKICFYVDADHNDGRSLETLGFTFEKWTDSGFMNVETATGKVTHRAPMQHRQIMDRMAKGEMYSVANAGTIVYVFDKTKNSLPKEA